MRMKISESSCRRNGTPKVQLNCQTPISLAPTDTIATQCTDLLRVQHIEKYEETTDRICNMFHDPSSEPADKWAVCYGVLFISETRELQLATDHMFRVPQTMKVIVEKEVNQILQALLEMDL